MSEPPKWVFLSSHAVVLLSVERHPSATVRELAEVVAVTERQVHRVLIDLENEGYITRKRIGRKNHYSVHRNRPMRGSAQEVGELLAVLTQGTAAGALA